MIAKMTTMVIILNSPAKDQHRWRFFQSPQGSGCGNYHKLTIAIVIIQWLHIIIIVTAKSKTSRIINKIMGLIGFEWAILYGRVFL